MAVLDPGDNLESSARRYSGSVAIELVAALAAPATATSKERGTGVLQRVGGELAAAALDAPGARRRGLVLDA